LLLLLLLLLRLVGNGCEKVLPMSGGHIHRRMGNGIQRRSSSVVNRWGVGWRGRSGAAQRYWKECKNGIKLNTDFGEHSVGRGSVILRSFLALHKHCRYSLAPSSKSWNAFMTSLRYSWAFPRKSLWLANRCLKYTFLPSSSCCSCHIRFVRCIRIALLFPFLLFTYFLCSWQFPLFSINAAIADSSTTFFPRAAAATSAA